MLQTLTDFAYAVCFSLVAVIGINVGTDEPKFEVVEHIRDGIEVRVYPSRVAAETSVDAKSENASNDAFRIVAGYIFGDNKGSRKIDMTSPVEINPSGQKIAMTSPVEMDASNEKLVMRFFMPSEYALTDLPAPNDERVKLVTIPVATVAVIKFSGLSDKKNERQIAELSKALAETKWKIAGAPSGYYYNPPWTLPFLRRNEVLIPVAKD